MGYRHILQSPQGQLLGITVGATSTGSGLGNFIENKVQRISELSGANESVGANLPIKTEEVLGLVNTMGAIQTLLNSKRNLDRKLFLDLTKLMQDLEPVVKPYLALSIKEPQTIKSQLDVMHRATILYRELQKLIDSEKNIMSLMNLTPSSNSFTATNSFLDLQKIAKDSPLRKIAESMSVFAKQIDVVQKNALDKDALTLLQSAINTGVEQVAALEEKVNTLNPQGKDTLTNLKLTPWSAKGVEIKNSLSSYIESLGTIRRLSLAGDTLKAAAQNTSVTAASVVASSAASSVSPGSPAAVPSASASASAAPTQKSSPDDTIKHHKELQSALTALRDKLINEKIYSSQIFSNLQRSNNEIKNLLAILDVPEGKNDKPLTNELVIPKTPQAMFALTQNILASLNIVLAQEKSFNGLSALASTATIMTAPNALLDVQKITVESPLRKLAVTFDDFQKVYVAWQKNIFDLTLSANLTKNIDQTLEQVKVLEGDLGSQPPQVIEIVEKIRQIGWTIKATESKAALTNFIDNSDAIKKQLENPERLRQALEIGTSGGFGFGLGLGFGSVTMFFALQTLPILFQIISLLCVLSCLLGTLKNRKEAPELLPKTSPETPPESLASSLEPNPLEVPLARLAPYYVEPVVDLKKNSLISDLKEQMQVLEKQCVDTFHSSEKVMLYFQEVSQKITGLRSENRDSDQLKRYLNLNIDAPIDEIDSAIIALKQLGVRLFLSILENHSPKLLASETQRMNQLVQNTETAFQRMKELVEEMNQKALPSRQQTDQSTLDVLELDMQQVMNEAKVWQTQLSELNKSLMSVNHIVGQYV